MQKDNGHILPGIQTVIFLELPKIDEMGDVSPESLNPGRQEYVRELAAEEGGIMEAKKTMDRISSDWVLRKRELDRDVIKVTGKLNPGICRNRGSGRE